MFRIVKKERLNPTVTKMVIDAPFIAKKAEPGQFIILRALEDSERIPLTIANYDRQGGTVTIIYQIVGGSTMELDTLEEGQTLHDFVGPLGVATHTEGLKKVADTLEHVDFENVGRDVSSAVNKAGKIVVNVSTEAARSVENAWNEAKDNRQKPGGVGDYRVSGSAVLDGGCYNKISCTGSCKVSSDLVCREISTSGSFHACGNVDVSGDIRATGAFRCDGNVQSGGMSCSGSTRIDGNLKSGLMNVPGS